MTHYQDTDISLAPLHDKTVVMVGYGNQGRPQALNCKDSGLRVIVGLRPGSPRAEVARQDGLTVLPLAEAVANADVVMMQVPDETMGQVYQDWVAPHLKPGAFLGFSHGMAIHAGWIKPQANINVFLLAPKAQGRGVRNQYVAGHGVPGLVAVHQDPSDNTLEIALAYGKAIGCSRAGILPTTFRDETECDLFSEQAVLCGGLTQLIKTAFDVLVEAGYSPEVAYFECLYEVKLIADLLQETGITEMRKRISSTALFGDISRGERVIDGHVKESMRRVLLDIQSGQFTQDFVRDVETGRPWMKSRVESDFHHPIEVMGRSLRERGIL